MHLIVLRDGVSFPSTMWLYRIHSSILADDAIITQKTYVKEEEIMVVEEEKQPELIREEAPNSDELSVQGKIHFPYTSLTHSINIVQ